MNTTLKNVKSSIKNAKKVIAKYKKTNYAKLTLFISDIIVLCLIISGFVAETVSKNEHLVKIFSYVTVAMSFYILVKFTITNFFYSDIFFRYFCVFDKEIEIKGIKVRKFEKINTMPVWFLTLLIMTNIISAVIINYQSSTQFSDNKVLSASVTTLTNIMLIPSFSAILNKITSAKTPALNNYTKMVKNQFITFKDLFKDIEPEDNFELLKFKDITLASKRGLFVVNNVKEQEKEITKFNDEVISIYNDLWKTYYEFLMETRETIMHKRTVFKLEREFDGIFINFFEF